MTVAELRDFLAQFDQELPVAIIDDGMIEYVYTAKLENKLWTTPDKPIVIIW